MKKRIIISFTKEAVQKSLISKAIRECNIDINIIKGEIDPGKGGKLVVEFIGEEKEWSLFENFLSENQVTFEELNKKIQHNKEKCIHCGFCTAGCSSDALVINTTTRELDIFEDNCIACFMCVNNCPLGLISINL